MTEADLVIKEGMERRRFLKAAATVAWATPAILTLTANRAGAQSCIPQGAPCDACVGVNCCIQSGDTLPCCCSDVNNTTTCAGVCRTQAQCEALFPSGHPEDPDSCWYPPETLARTSMRQVSRTYKAKVLRK
ncbi:MAG TPA: hypothetical protein VEU29_00215 [Actinomycetota bacterium]|nr:hypothetical protein [Actinomycetota bacterium]